MTLEYMMAHPKETTYMETDIPPTHEELVDQARDFYKANRKSNYKAMMKDGTLSEVCEAKAKRAEEYAHDLITSGEHPGPAWIRARRSIILESETD
jgi:hypothetical protein